MSCPVTAQDIRDLRADDGIPQDAVLTLFLQMARALMERVEECATNKGQTLTADQIRSIESLLAAHFSTLKYPVYSSEKSENASASLAIEVGKGLDASLYGQNAKALDTSKCLEEIAGEEVATAQIFWGGKPVSDQIDYWSRN